EDFASSQGDRFALEAAPEKLLELQTAFGYDKDEREMILAPMLSGTEPIGSMGDDTPLAVLSRRPRLLYTYFKQLFAQVTNPAIDSIRERSVMSLNMYLGGRLGLFEELPQKVALLELESPFLLPGEFAALEKTSALQGKLVTLRGLFSPNGGPDALE